MGLLVVHVCTPHYLSYYLYTCRYQKRLRLSQAEDCKSSLSWLSLEGLTPLKLTVSNVKTGGIEDLTLISDLHATDTSIAQVPISANLASPENNKTIVDQLVYVKDRNNISDRTYIELAKIEQHLPRLYQVKKRVSELNAAYEVTSLANGVIGVQQSLASRLTATILHAKQVCMHTPPEQLLFENNIVKVKLSGDGTNVGKRLHIINFTFTLLDVSPGSYEGNHILLMAKCEENYDCLSLALANIVEEVQVLQRSGIDIEGTRYQLEFFLGGDWKFLAIITGISTLISVC